MTSKDKQIKYLPKPEDNVFVCSVCQKVQTSVLEMRQHLKVHKTFQCEVCLRIFTNRQHLKKHLKTNHPVSEFSCPLCKKTFLHIRYLEQHVKIHNSVKRFICDVCGKQFNQLVHLQSHIATHMTQKNFICDHCDKEFSCKGSLLRHYQVHGNKDLYVCHLCNKRFTRKDSLAVHVQVIHERKKNHKCIECNLEFFQKACLKAHLEKVHLTTDVRLAKTAKAPSNFFILKDESGPKINLTFSVSILKGGLKKNLTPKTTLNKEDRKNGKVSLSNKVSQTIFENKTVATQKISCDSKESPPEPVPVGCGTKERVSEDKICLAEASSPIKPGSAVTFSGVNGFKEDFPNREKSCNNALALFSDSDMSEILDPAPSSLEANFLLDSLGDWDNDCHLPNEALPICLMDSEISNKDFLNIGTDDYFTSLQCSIPFADLN